MTSLDALRREWPAWSPWLAVVEATLHEAAAPAWEGMVPALLPDRARAEPLLAGTTICLDGAVVGPWIQRLGAVAALGGAAAADLVAGLSAPLETSTLFAASVSQDRRGLAAASAAARGDSDAFQALAALVPLPLLQACRRRWAGEVPAGWGENYCPVCGAWPAFAEVCGAGRSRQFRCGRCGAAWPAEPLCCPYCGTRDHHLLISLIPESSSPRGIRDSSRGIRLQPDSLPPASHGSIHACQHCLGYIKALTTLQACAPGDVMLEDLGSVDLDVAALGEGYRRLAGAGFPLEVTVAPARGTG